MGCEANNMHGEPREDECDHDQYEISWDGKATCEMCGVSWTATPKQIERHEEQIAAYEKEQRYWNRVDEGRQRAKDRDI